MTHPKCKALNIDEAKWLKRMEPAVDQHWKELSKFEQGFIEGVLERFRQYGMMTFLSARQWEVITGISEKIL